MNQYHYGNEKEEIDINAALLLVLMFLLATFFVGRVFQSSVHQTSLINTAQQTTLATSQSFN